MYNLHPGVKKYLLRLHIHVSKIFWTKPFINRLVWEEDWYLWVITEVWLQLSFAQALGDWHDLWPTDLNINRNHLLIKDYRPVKFEASWAKRSWVISCTNLGDSDLTFDLDLWPTDLNINRDHLLIKDYLPTKFEASGPKRSWVISCTRLRDTDIPTDMCNAICLLLRRGA